MKPPKFANDKNPKTNTTYKFSRQKDKIKRERRRER